MKNTEEARVYYRIASPFSYNSKGEICEKVEKDEKGEKRIKRLL